MKITKQKIEGKTADAINLSAKKIRIFVSVRTTILQFISFYFFFAFFLFVQRLKNRKKNIRNKKIRKSIKFHIWHEINKERTRQKIDGSDHIAE